MALNTKSKAYQGLLDKGYTAEQIQQMANNVESGMTTSQAITSVKQANTTQSSGPADGYATASERNRATGGTEFGEPGVQRTTPTQTTPEVKQETVAEQKETPVSTVSEIKQEGALKPLSQDYYNQTGDDAQNKIRYNLNQYRQSNPGLFSTYEDFKKNFSYNARNDEQKQTLDAWYGEYQKGMEYGAMPTADLYTQYKDGSISTSDLEILRTYNPEKYAELQAQINKGNIIQAYDDTAPSEKQDFQDLAYQYASELFKRFMNGDGGSEASKFFDEYKANMDSPEMMELQDKQTDLVEQGKNIQDQIATIQKDVEKEYEGTGATRSKINAIIADRTYDLQQQLRTINNEYEKYATQYNNRATQYQNEFQLQLQEYQVNMQARNQQMKELGFAMDLMNFETNEQKQQREWDYWVKQQEYTNGNINSKDYTTRHKAALKSVENLLAQYPGIPTQRSAEQMADDILKAIDNGSNLGAELTKINKFMQEKPEYKYMYNNTFGGSQGFGKTISIGGTDYVEYDGKLYTADDFNKKFGGATSKAKYTVVSDKVLTFSDNNTNNYGSFFSNPKTNDGVYYGECGKFVNDYLEEIGAGRPFGNEDIKTREGWINRDKDSPKTGTIAIFDYNHKSSDGINHGHVAVVISPMDKDGNFWVKDANFGSDGKVQTRKVNVKDVSLKGFLDPTLAPDGSKVSTGTNTATLTQEDTKLTGGLTTAGVTQLAKDMLNGEKTYSEIKAAYGDEGLNLVENKMLELQSSGFEKSTKITDPVKLSNLEKNWRDFYDKKAKEAQETLDWVNKMEEAYNLIDTDKNAASQAITIAYNKILDPGSVVREGEYARSAEGQSYLSQIQAKLEKMKDGGAGLTKKELESMINVAKKFSQNAEKIQLDAAKQTKVAIDKYGLTPEITLPVDIWNKLNSGDIEISSTTTNTGTTTSWQDGMNKSSDVFKPTTNIGGSRVPANFYQK